MFEFQIKEKQTNKKETTTKNAPPDEVKMVKNIHNIKLTSSLDEMTMTCSC